MQTKFFLFFLKGMVPFSKTEEQTYLTEKANQFYSFLK